MKTMTMCLSETVQIEVHLKQIKFCIDCKKWNQYMGRLRV